MIPVVIRAKPAAQLLFTCVALCAYAVAADNLVAPYSALRLDYLRSGKTDPVLEFNGRFKTGPLLLIKMGVLQAVFSS